MSVLNPNMTTLRPRAWRLSLARSPRLFALSLIVLLAAALRFANLGALGYANSYYTAGVASMLQSWHNFFFVAAEPGGSVSIDKPPLGLWLQAISAYVFGVNEFAVVLPQIIAGLLSVVLLYRLVSRRFGTTAGLLAALSLAIAPVAIATDRNNTMDSTLVLALLLAAWAFMAATERGKLRLLLLGALLVGVGFNIKMLQAFLPLPAFYALYVSGSPERIWRKIGNLGLASAALAVVSLAWPIAVDLTPANQRPYVGSSTNNTVLELIIGHNGLNRLLGMGANRGAGMAGAPPAGMRDGGAPPADGAWRGLPLPGAGQTGAPPTGAGGRPGRPGGMSVGQPGALRLFIAPLSKEASWLLPFGLMSMGLLAAGTRPRWPLTQKHQALMLWGGWLATSAIFFSVAAFFHEYYLTMLAVPLAALVGIGVAELWRLRARHPWIAVALLMSTAIVTLGVQYATARAYVATIWWWPLVVGCGVLGALLLGFGAWQRRPQLMAGGVGAIMAALLITPGSWSVLTMLYPTANTSLPSAYSGNAERIATVDGPRVNQDLLAFLQANTQDVKYLMAVPSAICPGLSFTMSRAKSCASERPR